MTDFLIIGADAAGLSAAVQIKRELPDASLKVINKGEIISYAACGIPYVISGDIASVEKLVHFTPETFERKKGIFVETGREAVDIFPEQKSIQVRNTTTGKICEETYEKLLVATGSISKKLPFIDYDEEGIFDMQNLEDLKKILAYMKEHKPKRAAVVGAGNRGLELAGALSMKQIDVHMFELLPEPASTWPSLIRKAVMEKMDKKKIHFFGGTCIKEIYKTSQGFSIVAENEFHGFDIVFSVAGTNPATGFCRDKMDTLENGALLIDRKGLTSKQDIYSAGDCASVYSKILDRPVYFPLGSTANRMGRIAGLNMAGKDIFFPGIVGTQIFKFFDLSLAKTGLSLEEAEEEGIEANACASERLDKAGYYPEAKAVKTDIVYDKSSGRILGASVISEGNASQLIDPVAVAVFAGLSVRELGWFDSAYAPPYAPVWNAWVSASLKHKLG
jgi:NADPH-dependent 2,4-dienoyl-CoA reductase/sulfur reductase-like enzyme